METGAKAGIYRHYKGNLYFVIGMACHSETKELMVVYTPLSEHTELNMFVRPVNNFLEMVKDARGETVPRFQLIVQAVPD